ILLDMALGRMKLLRLPPLAVGIGIYLPMSVILPTVVGAVIGWFYDRWARRTPAPDFAERMGTLAATGLIVGESLWGVVFAIIVYFTSKDAPLALVGDSFAPTALILGTAVFLALLAWIYAGTVRAVTSGRAAT